jgi:N-acylneuraminate cytidylyltransferase
MTTVCYVVNSQFIISHDSIFEGRVSGVHIPINRAVDIDTLLDFQIAEMLLSYRGKE